MWALDKGQGPVEWGLGTHRHLHRMWDILESNTVANGHEVEGACIRYKQLLTKVKLYSHGAADAVLAYSQWQCHWQFVPLAPVLKGYGINGTQSRVTLVLVARWAISGWYA